MKTRSPERDKAFKLYEKSGKTMKNSEIASKLGVSASQVAKWKSQDKWDSESLPNEKVKGKKSQKSKGNKKGGQKGNKNAIGNSGGEGGPIGNDKHLIHGGYSNAYWDTLNDEEKSIIDDMPQDEETLLIDQIKLYTVRERRILQAIQKVKGQSGEQILDSVSSQETKRRFRDDSQKEQYYQMIDEKIASGERLPGESYQIYTNTENKQNVISRLEAELTKVQRAKNQAIDSLVKLNLERQKLELIRDNNSEIEDTSETDEVIYGENSLQAEENDTV